MAKGGNSQMSDQNVNLEDEKKSSTSSESNEQPKKPAIQEATADELGKTKNISNEIDDFTRKLLDKKVELTLFPDDDITSSSLEGTMSEAQRKTAEYSMLTALDQVRRERGQTPISEEEKKYADQEKGNQSKPKKTTEKASLTSVVKEEKKSDPTTSITTPTKSSPLEPNRYETTSREDHFEKQEARPEQVKFYKKPKFWALSGTLIALLGLSGLYAWKVGVYDPQHISEVEQDFAYKNLVKYADEYGMMSENQRREIINLEDAYNSLDETKKADINEYYKDPKHTGKTFVELLNEYKQLIEKEQNDSLQQMIDYANTYPSLTQEQQLDITQKLEAYNALSQEGKDQVNAILKSSTTKDFTQLYNEARTKRNTSNQSTTSTSHSSTTNSTNATQGSNGTGITSGDSTPNNTTIPETPLSNGVSDTQTPAINQTQTEAQLREQLAQLQNDQDNYLRFLESEGLSPANDEIAAQYSAQISGVEALLGQ